MVMTCQFAGLHTQMREDAEANARKADVSGTVANYRTRHGQKLLSLRQSLPAITRDR